MAENPKIVFLDVEMKVEMDKKSNCFGGGKNEKKKRRTEEKTKVIAEVRVGGRTRSED